VTDHDVPDADFVIGSWWETAEWIAGLSNRKGVKVHFIQGHEIWDGLPAQRSQATYHLPFHKIVVAQWLKRVMCQRYGDTVVDLVPNSVDHTQFFAPVRGKQLNPTVGFIYSAAHVKGSDVALAAIRRLRARIPDLRMISFGGENPTQRLRLPMGAQFFHSPPQDEIRNLYASCDVWIIGSRSEGFNLPVLEAMACRTPVVSTRVGGSEDTVRLGWNGILVDIDDVDELTKGIEWVLTRNDEEWRTLSQNAHATASAKSWQDSARLFEKALEHAQMRAARGEIQGR
jgi:glycosyltransferase involved in cell wall biosynthesis